MEQYKQLNLTTAIYSHYWQYSHYNKLTNTENEALSQADNIAAIKQQLAHSGPVSTDSIDIYC